MICMHLLFFLSNMRDILGNLLLIQQAPTGMVLIPPSKNECSLNIFCSKIFAFWSLHIYVLSLFQMLFWSQFYPQSSFFCSFKLSQAISDKFFRVFVSIMTSLKSFCGTFEDQVTHETTSRYLDSCLVLKLTASQVLVNPF